MKNRWVPADPVIASAVAIGTMVWAAVLGRAALGAGAALGIARVPAWVDTLGEGLRASSVWWLLAASSIAPLVWLGWLAMERRRKPHRVEWLGPRLRTFLGLDPVRGAMPAAAHRSARFDLPHLPNLDAALDAFAAAPGTVEEQIGWVGASRYSLDAPGLTELVSAAAPGLLDDDHDGPRVGPIETRSFPIGPGRERACVVRGLRLIQRGEARLIALVRQEERYAYGQPGVTLEVLSAQASEAEGLLEWVRARVERESLYRGHAISLDLDALGRARGTGDHLGIRFHEWSTVAPDEIVLPEATRSALVRSTVEFVAGREALRAAGLHLRRGVLLHGPPGTGKSMVVRWLASALPGHTTVVAVGTDVGAIRAHFRLARLLQPALLVFEDVDLIALDRSSGGRTALLSELMNEMDGLSPDAEVLIVLTTNQPDVLEPALAARPGRVDQELAIPLPDGAGRRALLERVARGLELRLDRAEEWVARTDGASPAFLRELVRRAALVAAGAGTNGARLAVTDAHLEQALHEMAAGGLSRSLLGFHAR